jgi:hypothetical protein
MRIKSIRERYGASRNCHKQLDITHRVIDWIALVLTVIICVLFSEMELKQLSHLEHTLVSDLGKQQFVSSF